MQVAADFKYCASAFSAVKLCAAISPYSPSQTVQTALCVQVAVPPWQFSVSVWLVSRLQIRVWVFSSLMGALNVKKQFPDALLIFISAPSISELKSRLAGRGTESEETIIKRLRKATEEAEDMDKYDYIIVNDDLDECIHTVDSVIRSYGCRRDNQLGYIAGIKEELAEIKKL